MVLKYQTTYRFFFIFSVLILKTIKVISIYIKQYNINFEARRGWYVKTHKRSYPKRLIHATLHVCVYYKCKNQVLSNWCAFKVTPLDFEPSSHHQ